MKIILKAGYKFWAVSKRRQRKSLSLLVPFSPVSKHSFRTAATQCHNFIFLQTDRYMPNLVTISTDIREQAQVLYLPCSCDTFITLHNRLRQHKALLGWNVLREDELLFMEFYSLFFLILSHNRNLTLHAVVCLWNTHYVSHWRQQGQSLLSLSLFQWTWLVEIFLRMEVRAYRGRHTTGLPRTGCLKSLWLSRCPKET